MLIIRLFYFMNIRQLNHFSWHNDGKIYSKSIVKYFISIVKVGIIILHCSHTFAVGELHSIMFIAEHCS